MNPRDTNLAVLERDLLVFRIDVDRVELTSAESASICGDPIAPSD